MEFCHSFGESVSLACIETPEENGHLKDWLIENGKWPFSHRARFIINNPLCHARGDDKNDRREFR